MLTSDNDVAHHSLIQPSFPECSNAERSQANGELWIWFQQLILATVLLRNATRNRLQVKHSTGYDPVSAWLLNGNRSEPLSTASLHNRYRIPSLSYDTGQFQTLAPLIIRSCCPRTSRRSSFKTCTRSPRISIGSEIRVVRATVENYPRCILN